MLEGEVELLIGDGSNRIVRVPAGKAFVLPANLRVQWRWRGPCKYVPICLPAFSPENCGREGQGVTTEKPTAKDPSAMEKLKKLHATAGGASDPAVPVSVQYQVHHCSSSIGMSCAQR